MIDRRNSHARMDKVIGFERKTEIISLLEKNGKIAVSSLADKFDVCKETIRRDLRELEINSILKRTHGGAFIETQGLKNQDEFPFAVRKIQRHEEKLAICKRAASLISDGDVIFVDNSSTTIFLIRCIPRNVHVCVITNSLKLLLEAVQVKNPNLRFICLGGELKESNMSFSGMIPQKVAHDYYPSKAFLSCAGINEQQMLTDSSAAEVDTKKLMIDRSQKVFILADYTKFSSIGNVHLTELASVDCIITDGKTDVAALNYLKKHGIDLIVVE
jgi:DeoR family fructose operon transcriptional repressor